jgi:hypothetical protein
MHVVARSTASREHVLLMMPVPPMSKIFMIRA